MRNIRRLVAAAVIAVLCGAGWFGWSAYPLSSSGSQIAIRVSPGESVAQVATSLQEAGVLRSALAFRVDTMIFGAPLIRDGYYVIHKNASHGEIRRVLSSTPNAHVVTVFAGATIRQISRQMETVKSQGFASAWRSLALTTPDTSFGSSNHEGLLGTGAYIIGDEELPKTLLSRMQQRFVRQFAALGLRPESRVHGLSAYQFVTAASIVEKEGYYPKNMPKVARVILNRLARGGGLQMDATVLYFLDKDGVTVTPSMLQIRTPYNTYLSPGLTPTPIAQVGRDALEAMLHPPVGSWLYFVVVDKSGTEAFAVTYAEHLRNIELARSRGL